MKNNQTSSKSSSAPDTKRIHRGRGCLVFSIGCLLSACGLAVGLSSLSNILLPSRSPVTDRLGDLGKARLAEAFHLRRDLGNTLWPGWGEADIPMIVYNEEYAFLVGYPNPPAGWKKIPTQDAQGGPWEAVPNDTYGDQTYYRQRLPNQSITPQAFAVLVGDRWVSSMPSREWMEVDLGNSFRKGFPPIFQPVFPYRLAARLFLSAAGGKDMYICALLHESFHAYQGLHVPARLSAAETVFNQNKNRYPSESGMFRVDWQAELNILADAVQAKSDPEAAELVRQFLDHRRKRRAAADLDALLIDLEREKEWEEGLAKYTELAIWRLAASTEGYSPLPAMAGDPGFLEYSNFDQIWSQQVTQIRNMAGDEGDTRFYYTGLAQAILLDRLAPDWRTKILTEAAALEDLLKDALQ